MGDGSTQIPPYYQRTGRTDRPERTKGPLSNKGGPGIKHNGDMEGGNTLTVLRNPVISSQVPPKEQSGEGTTTKSRLERKSGCN